MPPWFTHWYQDILQEVHRKLGDPEVAISWLQDQLKAAGQPGVAPDTWKAGIHDQLKALPEPPAYALPDGWELLVQQSELMSLLKGEQALEHPRQAHLIESSVQGLLSNQAVKDEQALLLWKYFLGNISPQEDHQLRHWVDAEPEHLEAFEQRFELWDQLRSLPMMIHARPKDAWEQAYGSLLEPEPSAPADSRRKLLILLGIILGFVVVLGLFNWLGKSESIPFELSSTMSGVVLSGEEIPVLSGQTLEFEGTIQLLTESQDSIRLFDGLIVLAPGIYQLHAESSKQSLWVQEGSVKAFWGEEILIGTPGIMLKNEGSGWLKLSE